MLYHTGRSYDVYAAFWTWLMATQRRLADCGPEDLGCRTCASKLLPTFLMSDADLALQNGFSVPINGLR